MKVAALAMMPAGWFIVLSALVMLKGGGTQGLFVVAGLGVEVLGLIIFGRSHLPSKGGQA